MKSNGSILVVLVLLGLVVTGWAAEHDARAELVGPDQTSRGTIDLVQTPHGVLISLRLKGLPPGAHSFHIHGTGACTPTFKAAGGHFNPHGRKHGILQAEGMHAGDLPNIHAGPDGRVETEILWPHVSVGFGGPGAADALLDSDGSAFVIHANPDDYRSDPAGKGGPRIACGVVVR